MDTTECIVIELVLLGSFDQGHQNHHENDNDNAPKQQGHLEILPGHLLSQVGGFFLEDRGLFIELVGLFGQAIGFFRVLEHVRNVILHLSLDHVDLSKQRRCFVNLAQIIVLRTSLRQDILCLSGKSIFRSGSNFRGKLVHYVGIKLLQHLNGNSRRISQPSNDRQTCI